MKNTIDYYLKTFFVKNNILFKRVNKYTTISYSISKNDYKLIVEMFLDKIKISIYNKKSKKDLITYYNKISNTNLTMLETVLVNNILYFGLI